MLSEKVAQRKTLLFLSCGQFPCHTSRPLKTKLLSCLKEGGGGGGGVKQTEKQKFRSYHLTKLATSRTSLVVCWIKTHFPMQGTCFDPWSGKISQAVGQLSPRTTTTEACHAVGPLSRS